MLNTLENSILNMEPLGLIAWSVMVSMFFMLFVGSIWEQIRRHYSKKRMQKKLDQKQREIFGELDGYLPEFIKATDEQIGYIEGEVIELRAEGTK
tara:strand:- start:1731 stop:2015 length:285 start_codon:yes stop_codon:yes gene_type:complete